MFAYQMIYTACGKDKSGAFSVWSKSQEISKQECDEIIKLMNYRKPRNAPYEPAEDEIKRLFPKKYAYFVLSTGRLCIAQSSYVGNVYSELDGRTGNFLIHAFVFEKLEDINPYFIFDNEKFKSELTYIEWHDKAAPDYLAPIDISIPINVNNVNIRELLNVLGNKFLMLLQAIIKSTDNDEKLIFIDSEEKQKVIYNLIGLLLPKCILEKATFSTQYSSQSEYAIQSIGGIPVKIRNIMDVNIPNAINLQEAIDAGDLVFAFDKNIFSNLEIGRYVNGIAKDVMAKSLFGVLSEVDDINKIMINVQCDIEMAYSIYKFINKEYTYFDDIEEIMYVFEKASKYNYIDVEIISHELYETVFKSNQYRGSKYVLPFLSKIYSVANKELKWSIIIDFFNMLNEYIPLETDNIIDVFKRNAPCQWEEFVTCIVENDYYFKNANQIDSFSKQFLIYRATLDALVRGLGDKEKNKKVIVSIVAKSLQNKRMSEISILIKEGKTITNEFEDWIFNSTIKKTLISSIGSEGEMKFAFELSSIFENEIKEQCIRLIISQNINSLYLLPIYKTYSERDYKFFETLERKLSKEETYRAFLLKLEAYQFQKIENITAHQLDGYLNKFYFNGLDNGAFAKQLANYLSTKKGVQKGSECLKYFEKLSKLPDNYSDILELYRILEKEIYQIPLTELLKLQVSQLQQLSQLDDKLKTYKISTSGKFEILIVMAVLSFKFGSVYSEQQLIKGELYKGLSSQQLSILFSEHIDLVLWFYFAIKKEAKFDTNVILSNIFLYAFDMYYDFNNCLLRKIGELKDKEYYQLMADFMAYAFWHIDSLSVALKDFINKYLNTLKKSEYKKLFKQVQSLLDERTRSRVDPFIDDYLEQHKGFFAKLFSKSKKEK